MNTIVRTRNLRPSWDALSDFDDVINGIFRPVTGTQAVVPRTPALDVIDRGDHYTVEAELPGVEKENVEISIDDGVLTVSAKLNEETLDESANVLRRERKFGEFARSLRLGDDVDGENVGASYDKGVLAITLPKVEQTLPRRIEIK
jgi:HSP20 family protein